jgi:excisionase family DNA binding protein
VSGKVHKTLTGNSPEPLAVRVPEACRMIGIGRSKFYELIAEGAIKAVKIGSVTVIPIVQLKALIEQ